MRQFKATVRENVEVAPEWRHVSYEWPAGLPPPLPGQFFTFRPAFMTDAGLGLLRRPLAFADFVAGSGTGESTAHAVYQMRGPSTRMLGDLQPGSEIDVIGPLGKPFSPGKGYPLLAGGGIGVGPVLFLARSLVEQGLVPGKDFTLVLGFRDAQAVPRFGDSRIAGLMASASLRTDDGSAGDRGSALDGLKSARERVLAIAGAVGAPKATQVRACGPGPMLAAIADWVLAEGIPAQLSAEQWMACGVGACHGCVLPASAGGYLRACADGPVFDSRDIRWKECP